MVADSRIAQARWVLKRHPLPVKLTFGAFRSPVGLFSEVKAFCFCDPIFQTLLETFDYCSPFRRDGIRLVCNLYKGVARSWLDAVRVGFILNYFLVKVLFVCERPILSLIEQGQETDRYFSNIFLSSVRCFGLTHTTQNDPSSIIHLHPGCYHIEVKSLLWVLCNIIKVGVSKFIFLYIPIREGKRAFGSPHRKQSPSPVDTHNIRCITGTLSVLRNTDRPSLQKKNLLRCTTPGMLSQRAVPKCAMLPTKRGIYITLS